MKFSAKKIVLIGMLAAIAYIMVFLIRIPILPAVPFLKYEPKDVIITIGGFLLGPMAAFLTSLVVSLVEMLTISETGPIGALMNLLSTCSFACTAAIIYKRRHTLGGAILGLGIGSILTVIVMLLWNWLITPLYMGQPREAVEALLLPAFLPFNLLKTGLNSALVLLLYKPLVSALRKAKLAEAPAGKHGSSKIGIYLLGAGLLATCILLILVFQGKL
ncbi:MAG: ECF transporter S component [Oscillospiraceae bacterium]|nr:ECF transporter S component [Oscillospiraceae bacterium]